LLVVPWFPLVNVFAPMSAILPQSSTLANPTYAREIEAAAKRAMHKTNNPHW